MDDLGVVETVYTGSPTATAEELQKAVSSSLAFAAEHGAKLFLSDCRALAGGQSILPVYEVGEFYSNRCVSRKVREAVILPRDRLAADNLQFYETTTRNRGFNVRVFADRDSALAWLTEAPKRPD